MFTIKLKGRRLLNIIYLGWWGDSKGGGDGVESRNETDVTSFSALKRKRELERSQLLVLLKPQMRDN